MLSHNIRCVGPGAPEAVCCTPPVCVCVSDRPVSPAGSCPGPPPAGYGLCLQELEHNGLIQRQAGTCQLGQRVIVKKGPKKQPLSHIMCLCGGGSTGRRLF